MNLFNVYPRFSVEIDKGSGSFVFDNQGIKYLDMYGGHAVISIGHSHPHYVQRVTDQLGKIGFYSNSVEMPIQNDLARKLGEQSGYADYDLFLVNSGAEAIENALKLASFGKDKYKIIAFDNAFHGRTSAAVQITDNLKIQAPLNRGIEVIRLPLNDIPSLKKHMDDQVVAIITEGIQGIGGMDEPDNLFLQKIQTLCNQFDAAFILDEIQSGYGRSGTFFAHQKYNDIRPDLITIAKGMGNGFPVGGLLIAPHYKAAPGLLGTTFGGNQLACAAALAVLEVFEQEHVLKNVEETGAYLKEALQGVSKIKAIRGRGLMLALDFDFPIKELRNNLIFKKQIFTGSSKSPNTMRLLPPLTIKPNEIDIFVTGLNELLEE